MIWLKFIAIQLIMLLATVVGWFLLIPFCLALRGNRPTVVGIGKLADGRPRAIDVWPVKAIDAIYGNKEDGVSGRYALVWGSDGRQHGYVPPGPEWLAKRIAWSAYCWSAWRNSADNLKYVFADPKGPLVTFKLFGRSCKIGWQQENGFNVPVLSL
jgi:hypothetical protein